MKNSGLCVQAYTSRFLQLGLDGDTYVVSNGTYIAAHHQDELMQYLPIGSQICSWIGQLKLTGQLGAMPVV